MKREIQAVADAHSITFDKAAKSMCESLEKAYGDKDVIFRYKNNKIKAMRRLDDQYLNAVLSEALNERIAQWMQ